MRFMLVGTGFAEAHIRWIQESGTAEVAVLAFQKNESRAQALADRYGIREVTSRPFNYIKDGGIDAISIVTPPDTHEALIVAGLTRGLGVVTDKPIAQSSRVSAELAHKAALMGGRVAVTFQWRQHPAFGALRERIAFGAYGRVVHAELQFHHDYLAGPATTWPWRHVSEEAGGGALGDQAVHLFDLLRWVAPGSWTGTGASTTRAWDTRQGPAYEVNCETDDIADVYLRRGEDGALARIFASRVAIGRHELSLCLTGSEGCVRIVLSPEDGAGYLEETRLDTGLRDERFGAAPLNPYGEIVQKFADPDGYRGRAVADFDDGHAAQVFIEAALRLAGNGAPAPG